LAGERRWESSKPDGLIDPLQRSLDGRHFSLPAPPFIPQNPVFFPRWCSSPQSAGAVCPLRLHFVYRARVARQPEKQMSYISRHFLRTGSLAIAATLCLLGGSAMAWDWSPGNRVPGSGQVGKTPRQVQGFKGISLDLASKVEVIQGETEGLVIETDDNIAPLIETVVEDGQLKIRLAQRFKSLKPTVLKRKVQVRSLERISISGSGDVNAQKLQSPTLEVRIAGSGDLKTGALASKNVRISIAGAGDAVIWASQTLAVSIAGSGDVDYYGDATVTQSVAGSGRIRKLVAAPARNG
jgi:hypothetical protein